MPDFNGHFKALFRTGELAGKFGGAEKAAVMHCIKRMVGQEV